MKSVQYLMKSMLRLEEDRRFAERLFELLGEDASDDALDSVRLLMERAEGGDLDAMQLLTDMARRYRPDLIEVMAKEARQAIAKDPELYAALAKAATEEQVVMLREIRDNPGQNL